jgi:hypothetical protein
MPADRTPPIYAQASTACRPSTQPETAATVIAKRCAATKATRDHPAGFNAALQAQSVSNLF